MGGAERLILDSLPALAEAFDVEVTTCPLPGERPRPLVPGGRTSSASVVRGDTDLLYTHLSVPSLLARVGRALGSRNRWVHVVHFDDYRGLRLGRIRRWLDTRWVYPAADRLVAVSPRVAEHLTHVVPGGGGVALLENAVDMTAAGEASGDSPAEDGFVLGCVAMLRPEKGVDDLLRATALLVERGRNPRLRLAGDGPERRRLEALVSELGLEDRVQFLGWVDRVEEAYRTFDVYVQPSRAESFGLAAIESARFGLPLVVAPEGNLPAVANAGGVPRGLVADRSGPREMALAVAIETVLDDRERWRARACDARAYWAGRLDPAARRRAEVVLLQGALAPRIVHVAPIVTHGGGGLPRQVELQTRALDAAGHRVFLVQRPDPGLSTDTDARARWRHLTRWEVGPRRLTGAGSRLRERVLGARFTLRALLRLIRRRSRYDVIHAHQLYSPTLIGAVVKALTGVPLVVRVTAAGDGVGEVRELSRLPFQRLRRWAMSRIDVVVAQTPLARRELVAAGIEPERVRVVPSAVELPPVPIPQPRGRGGAYTLLYAGRYSAEKGLDVAVRALALLADAGRDVRLRLVGRADPDRDTTAQVQELARTLDVEARLEWGDFTDALHEEHAAADAFLLPSRSEGMSNALLEAAAAGMVCVASDIPQNRAVTGQQGARYFTPDDPEALASVVAGLIDDRATGGSEAAALGRAARGRVADTNAPERVAAALAEIYTEVTGDSGATG